MAKHFEIKITGDGAKNHIIHSLYDIIRTLEKTDSDELDGMTLEDPVLCAEITEI